MFPFWNSRGRILAKLGTGKPVTKILIFSRSAVSFRSRNSRISRFLELTSGGWNFKIVTDP